MIQINQLKMPVEHKLSDVKKKAAALLRLSPEELPDFQIVKRSLDARKKPDLWFSYVVRFSCSQEDTIIKKIHNPNVSQVKKVTYSFPTCGEETLETRPIVIGAGPGGLFCAYFLAKHGYKPILLERGKDVDARQQDVEHFWNTGKLNPASNVQFGEGGAGTFSDGKLNTLVKDKDGKGRKVLELFVECGAPEEILYENKPHIGTDILRQVVKNMRTKILEMGGTVRFEARVTDLELSEGKLSALWINDSEKIPCQVAVLAIGHSARDTFSMLYEKGIPMEAKDFAVGFRVEHPQSLINLHQYGDLYADKLPAAPYKLVAKTKEGRGVYSFCMCPGGYVVNASSEPGRLAVNGMSYSGRNGANANSAIIVAVSTKDFPTTHPLAGIEFQRQLEERAYKAGNGKIPVEKYGDFRKSILQEQETHFPKEKESFPASFKPSLKGDFAYGDLSTILPTSCNRAFVQGMEHFGQIIPGFSHPDTLLSGVESRTSSPVRIPRDGQGESTIAGLYPCGEGAGYAGGITSAAMDGITVAEKIAARYHNLD